MKHALFPECGEDVVQGHTGFVPHGSAPRAFVGDDVELLYARKRRRLHILGERQFAVR